MVGGRALPERCRLGRAFLIESFQDPAKDGGGDFGLAVGQAGGADGGGGFDAGDELFDGVQGDAAGGHVEDFQVEWR